MRMRRRYRETRSETTTDTDSNEKGKPMKSMVEFLLTIVFTASMLGTTVDGRFVVLSNTGTTYAVKVQFRVDAAMGLGGTTVKFSYNDATLSIPATPTAGVDYSFAAFSGGSYSTATVTKSGNVLSINTEYNSDPGSGTPVNTGYTDVVTINFTTLAPGGNAALHWTQLEILGDDYAQWSNGLFPDENTDPLPVQLTAFTATLTQQANAVQLKWTTASEMNNYGYTVQRKAGSDVEFADLKDAFIAGKGTTIEPQAYSYTDNTVTKSGTHSYRLKQQDMDGTIHHTQGVIVQVTLTDVAEVAPQMFQLLQNYPNPFNPSTQVKFSVASTTRATVKVYNMLGEEVATMFDGVAEAGRYYAVTFNGTGLASGVYFYRLATEQKTDVKRLLLVR
jgi:hypothetical protein